MPAAGPETATGGRVVVVGLGPGDPGALTAAALEAIEATPIRYVRTTHHPSAKVLAAAWSFDAVYESASSLEEVYATIAATLVEAAGEHGSVLYAVPGSPLVAERSVELLRADERVSVELLPALSFLDLAWARLGVDPVAVGVRIVDGHRFAVEAAGSSGPLLVAQCDRRSVLSEIKLSVDGEPGPAVVLRRLGLPDESVTEVAWADLDRSVEPDHLTCVWIPTLAVPVAGEAARFVELVRTLRERCPWDREQTHRSLRRHLLEEAYEVLEAVDELEGEAGGGEAGTDDVGWEHLEEELGDLLFQVAFHAQLATEEGRFGFADVARGIHDKLVARHPHVFTDAGDTTVAELDQTWEDRKRAEKGRSSVVDGIPSTLPALTYALKAQRRAAGAGLDWPGTDGVWAAVADELDELRDAVAAARSAPGAATGDLGPAVEAELGDVLFSVVNLARHLGVEPELALRSAARRFTRRVREVEGLGAAEGLDHAGLAGLPPEQLDRLWAEAKRLAGRPAPPA